MSEQTDKNEQVPRTCPGRTRTVLLASLGLINIGFLMILLFVTPRDSAGSIADIETSIRNQKNGFEIELHLTRYILLKMQIQNMIDKNGNREEILSKINEAVVELQTLLNIPHIESFLEPSKRRDIQNEIEDMKRLKTRYS